MRKYYNKLTYKQRFYQNTTNQKMLVNSDIQAFPKTFIAQQFHQDNLNPFANYLFNHQWTSLYQEIYQVRQCKKPISKANATAVSLKKDIIQWLKSLSVSQQIDILAIENPKTIQRILKFSKPQFKSQQINFQTQLTMIDFFTTDQEFYTLSATILEKVKDHLCLALKNQTVLYLDFNFQTNKPENKKSDNLNMEDLINWMEQVSEGNLFEYAHKIPNKECPEDNLLWFSSQSFHSFQQGLVNQLQKIILKAYFKKQTLTLHNIKGLEEFLMNKYPKQAQNVKIPLIKAQKITVQKIQQISKRMKAYQNEYFESLRQSFIETLENLENDQKDKKKRKNKRKGKKRVSVDAKLNNNNDKQRKQREQRQGQKQSLIYVQKTNKQEKISANKFYHTFQSNMQTQDNMKKQLQSTGEFQVEQNIEPIEQKPKKCNCQEQTISNISHLKSVSQQQKKKPKKKNFVSKTKRCYSPKIKTSAQMNNKRDNQSVVHSNQSHYETFTEAIKEECKIKAQEEFEMSQEFNKNRQYKQFNGQSPSSKKRRKKKNNNSSKNLQEMVKKTTSGLVNKQLTNFIDSLSIQTNNLYESKVISFERVRYFIKNIFPSSQAMLFGSNSMGLSLPSSDVDIMLYNLPCSSKEEMKQILAQIAIEINAMGWIVSCSTYLSAKTPIVKLQIDPIISYFETKRRCDYQNVYDPMVLYYLDIKQPNRARNIHVDLTINLENNSASPSTELMRSYVNQDPTLQRIILVFKYILAEKSYNKNFSGGLGSYCLFIMITAYFKEFRQTLSEDQGQIFLDILKFYSEQFENKLKSITLRENESCYISLEQTLQMSNISDSILSNPLRIIDPISHSLMSSSCAQYHCIKAEFRRIRMEIIEQFENIERQIVNNYTSAELGKMVGNQKSIDKFVSKYQNRYGFSIKKIIDGKAERT